jgi:hypothetical protein
MVDTKIIPRTRVPALDNVLMAICDAFVILPVITSYIVLYIPAPGTKGIRQHITKVVTGVLSIRAKVSEYILKQIDDINKEKISEKPTLSPSA